MLRGLTFGRRDAKGWKGRELEREGSDAKVHVSLSASRPFASFAPRRPSATGDAVDAPARIAGKFD